MATLGWSYKTGLCYILTYFFACITNTLQYSYSIEAGSVSVWVSELVYLTSFLSSHSLMSDGPPAGQWDKGWKCPRLEYTVFRTWDPVASLCVIWTNNITAWIHVHAGQFQSQESVSTLDIDHSPICVDSFVHTGVPKKRPVCVNEMPFYSIIYNFVRGFQFMHMLKLRSLTHILKTLLYRPEMHRKPFCCIYMARHKQISEVYTWPWIPMSEY